MENGLDRGDAKVQLPEAANRWKVSSAAVDGVIRTLCLLTSVAALSVMITAEQAGVLSFYGFSVLLYSKWSLSDSFRYVVGVSVGVAAYSSFQLLIIASKAARKIRTPRSHTWLVFTGDQIFAYLMISAGSAASGVTSLNRTGIRHSALPNFCKPLDVFCGRVAVSISFVFVTGFLLAVSVVLDVISLAAPQ